MSGEVILLSSETESAHESGGCPLPLTMVKPLKFFEER
jgi:hypothetical protein